MARNPSKFWKTPSGVLCYCEFLNVSSNLSTFCISFPWPRYSLAAPSSTRLYIVIPYSTEHAPPRTPSYYLRSSAHNDGALRTRTTRRRDFIGTVRSREFWLYHGSVVLLVENILFRVYQTILANHSEVFADLFKLPQSSEDSRLVEGKNCIDGSNVVHLHNNADDFPDLQR